MKIFQCNAMHYHNLIRSCDTISAEIHYTLQASMPDFTAGSVFLPLHLSWTGFHSLAVSQHHSCTIRLSVKGNSTGVSHDLLSEISHIIPTAYHLLLLCIESTMKLQHVCSKPCGLF